MDECEINTQSNHRGKSSSKTKNRKKNCESRAKEDITFEDGWASLQCNCKQKQGRSTGMYRQITILNRLSSFEQRKEKQTLPETRANG